MEGYLVFLRLQPHKQTSSKNNRTKKLRPQIYGPYNVTKRIGKVAYELELPNNSWIQNVFLVSNFKKVLGQHVVPCAELVPLDDEGQLVLELAVILNTREKALRN